ncbi:DEAD/DEAH box helicase family protein [Candidatus Micrarchaeota archaeon]|nr:DEAD/DEAH box helicase family protein [Candidatus Micrarchaeota archaeon]
MESEAQTRKSINEALERSGWKVIPFEEGKNYSRYSSCAITEFPTESGPVDYLLSVNGEAIGVVEAKKRSLAPQNVLSQALRYARGISPLKYGEFGVPFAYSTNGELVWFQDIREEQGYSRQVAAFHTPTALLEMLSDRKHAGLRWMENHVQQHPSARRYQIEAVQSIERGLQDGKRQMLVAMATGTGKTFTMANQIYRLMKSGYARRILFLVDRRALAAQAVREFSTFEAEPGKKFDKLYEVYSQRFKREDFEESDKFDPKVMPSKYLTDPQPGQAFVYVCTIQRMMINLFGRGYAFDEEDGDPSDELDLTKLDIPIHAFDVIVADECHRGYTAAEISKWRNVLDYFDGVKIGLTATPAAHTKAYFKDIIFRYDYDQAVKDGYLVDYDVVTIDSRVKMKGLFLKESELVGIIDTERGLEKLDKVEAEREFESTKIEREVTSPDSTQKVVKELSKSIQQQSELLGHFPKTLIFAVNDLPHISHADRLVKALREEFKRGDSFVQKITGSPTVDRPLQRIREFRNRPEPGIVVTVDMLSTGVDVPAIENIVFLRPVKSRILFTQMMGRGTRTCKEIGKTHFTVFDCFGGTLMDYFRKATDLTVEPPDKPTRMNKEIIEDIYKNKDRDYNVTCLVRRLQRIAKNMSGNALEDFSHFIPEGDVGKFAQSLPGELRTSFAKTIGLLRDEGFQNLLLSYQRKPKTFLIAYESQDEVSSEYVLRTVDGRELKPEDYIKVFERFVKENPEKIEAVRILLSRPSKWSTDALNELRAKLSKTPEKFTEERLRKAYHNELADIISIVKHAAKDEPLLSSLERVEKAMRRLTKGKKFNAEQRKWLELIKGHLVVNLAIDGEDLKKMPIFADEGGLKRANKVFDGKIAVLLKQVNEEMAK